MICRTVIPLARISPIKFGATRDAVRMEAGPEFEEFRKAPSSRNTDDDYGSFHVYYGEGGVILGHPALTPPQDTLPPP